ncbi:MAG: class III extradiol ring-cleavage dioxygenase [Aquabacterium sp.]
MLTTPTWIDAMPDTLPSLFLSHGSPMIAIEPGAAGRFMQQLGPHIDALWGRPKAIVAVSPHSAARTPLVLGGARHEAIHDFGGFPQALYEIRYAAPGEPVLAGHVAERLQQVDAQTQCIDQGGLDHGIWTVLMHLYPQADVPVVPVALPADASPQMWMALGAALAPLRAEGVLVMGSGSLTHNLRRFFTRPTPVDAPEEPDCAAFRTWVATRSEAGDWPALLDYRQQAPHAVLMHPSDEHWLPFYFAAGAGADLEAGAAPLSVNRPSSALRLHASVTHGHLAMDAYGFGPADQLAKLAKVLSS